MQILSLLATASTLVVGFLVLLANPSRPPHRAFALLSLLWAGWLLCIFGAARTGHLLATGQGEPADLIAWLRVNAIVSAFAPWALCFLQYSIVATDGGLRRALVRSFPCLAVSIALASLCFMESFVFRTRLDSSSFTRGTAYYVFMAGTLIVYLALLAYFFRAASTHSGLRRLELRFLTINSTIAIVGLCVLNALGNLLELRELNRGSILVIVAFHALTAWALASRRLFNAGHAFAIVGHRLSVAAFLAITAWGLSHLLHSAMPLAAAWVTSIVLVSLAGYWLESATRAWFGLDERLAAAALRDAVTAISRRTAGSSQLIVEFERLLSSHHKVPRAILLRDEGDRYAGGDLSLSKESPACVSLCADFWATPEKLQRQRPSEPRRALADLLRQHSLALLIAAPRGSHAPTLLVALAAKPGDIPFSYPEVEILFGAAEMMDGILIRSRLTDQAAMQARMEHLAMMSRGLAHDLKNLLTPVSVFLEHTKDRAPAGGTEAEVHSIALRSVAIMTDYLREAQFFADNLQPRLESVDLAHVFRQVVEATASRASPRRVSVITRQDFNHSVTADDILLQRMLANLVSNSIDASSPGATVTLSASPAPSGLLRLQVADTGCGIAPETLARIFDPYFTTKQFGSKTRGFGLGLAIVQKIVHLHKGVISVQSSPGKGTIITIDLPPQPPAVA